MKRSVQQGEFPRHADDVVEPGFLGMALETVQGGDGRTVEIGGIGPDRGGITGSREDDGFAFDGHGQHKAVVVVGVFADDIDPSGRPYAERRDGAEMARKPGNSFVAVNAHGKAPFIAIRISYSTSSRENSGRTFISSAACV